MGHSFALFCVFFKHWKGVKGGSKRDNKKCLIYLCFLPIAEPTFGNSDVEAPSITILSNISPFVNRHANVQNRIFCKCREEHFHMKIPPFPNTDISKNRTLSNMFSLKRGNALVIHSTFVKQSYLKLFKTEINFNTSEIIFIIWNLMKPLMTTTSASEVLLSVAAFLTPWCSSWFCWQFSIGQFVQWPSDIASI